MTSDNIKENKKDMRRFLDYFQKWYLKTLKRKEEKGVWDKGKRGKTFLSITTYNNLRVGIAAFLNTKIVLLLSKPPAFVPFLPANTSLVEATFSQTRGVSAETPRRYETNAGIVDPAKKMSALDANTMYDGDRNKVGTTTSVERSLG